MKYLLFYRRNERESEKSKGKGVLEMKARLFLFSMFLLIPFWRLPDATANLQEEAKKRKTKKRTLTKT